jgi:hypothetical protein
LQRSIASKRRPMAGIYSASGQDAESRRRIDFMLSMLRRPCSSGARLDAFAIQLDSIKFTSKYPQNKQAATWDIAYRAQVAFLEEGDKAGMKDSVVIANDATVYWHFGDTYGLTTQAQRLAALEDDIVDMIALAMAHPSALKINGKPFFAFYVDSPLVTVAEWKSVLDGARTKSGQDFYALGTTLNATFFGAFDALAPWVNLGLWKNTSTISDTHDRAVKWSDSLHTQIKNALAQNPGRVLVGGVTPGFDDYTQNWGACEQRQIPRDPALLTGQFDYLKSIKQEVDLRALFFETWDDWTEGTEFEPDIVEGTTKLAQARQLIGSLFGEPDDPGGDQALDDAWKNFGQARNCCFAGGACPPDGPAVDLTCPASDGGVGGSSSGGAAGSSGSGGSGNSAGDASAGKGGSGKGGSSPDAGSARPANADDDGSCGCRQAPSSNGFWPFALIAFALGCARRRANGSEK